MKATLTIEEYGFMVFPEVFDGPPWATYPADASEEPEQPRGHLAAIVVDGSTTLGGALNRAAAEFGIALSEQTLAFRPGATVADGIDGVAFYLPGDEDMTWIPKNRFVRQLPSVDAAGKLWMKDYCEAPIEELQRAGAAGLVDGDVLHPYLRPWVSAGAIGGVAGEWASVVEALRLLWHVLDTLGPLGALPTLVWLGQPILKRLRRATDAVERTSAPLADRGIRPGQLAVLLSRRRWLPSECARLLGMSEETAVEFLAVLGFEPDAADVWEAKPQLAGSLVKVSVDIVTYADLAYPPEVEARIRYAVEAAEKTGRTPQLEDVLSDSVWSWDEAEDAEE